MTPADVVDALREAIDGADWTVERSSHVSDFVREEERLDLRLTRSSNVQGQLPLSSKDDE